MSLRKSQVEFLLSIWPDAIKNNLLPGRRTCRQVLRVHFAIRRAIAVNSWRTVGKYRRLHGISLWVWSCCKPFPQNSSPKTTRRQDNAARFNSVADCGGGRVLLVPNPRAKGWVIHVNQPKTSQTLVRSHFIFPRISRTHLRCREAMRRVWVGFSKFHRGAGTTRRAKRTFDKRLMFNIFSDRWIFRGNLVQNPAGNTVPWHQVRSGL